MRIKFENEKGSGQELEVKGQITSILLDDERGQTTFKLEKDKELKRLIWVITEKGHVTQQEVKQVNWIGLWITTKGYIVSVISKDEAYIITEAGRKLAHCKIGPDGETELVGKLMERRRGEEQFSLRGKEWPKLILD